MIIASSIPYGINEYIYRELLQGARNRDEFEKLKQYLATIPFYSLSNTVESSERAAEIYLRCRQGGITVRSTIDVLIAQSAIEHGVQLLHSDTDFTRMASCIPELSLYSVT